MRYNKFLFLPVILVIACNYGSTGHTHDTQKIILPRIIGDTTNQLVYDFIQEVIKVRDLNPALLLDPVVADHHHIKTTLLAIQQDTRNKSSDPSQGLFSLDKKRIREVVSDSDLQAMLEQTEYPVQYTWNADRLGFHQTDSSFWYTFSQPVFNPGRTLAAMTIQHLCPGLCGTTRMFFFHKDDDGWHAYQWEELWH